MEDSWRFRAIQGNNICPTCSIYHFPFCPPPPQPSSSMNPSFQKPPYFDPIPNNRPIPRSLDDGYGYIPPAAPVFQRDSFHPISRYDYGGSELRSREFVESDRIVKRMRVVGEMSSDYGSASFSQTRFPTEDERRLSLVREHGVPSIAPPSHIGVDSMSSSYGTQVGNSYGDWQQPRHHLNNSSFYDSMGGSVLLQEALVRRNNVYDDKKEIGRVEHDFGYDYDQLKSNTDGDGTLYRSRLQSHYGQNDDSVNYSLLPSYAPASGLTDAPNYVNTSSSHQEGSSALLRGERFQQPHISDYAPYSNQQESHNVYHGSSVSLYQNKQNFHIHGEQNDARQSFDFRHAAVDDVRTSVAVHSSSRVEPYSAPKISEQESYLPISTGNGLASTRQVGGLTSQPTSVYPPLPPLPPPAALSVYPPLPPLPPPSLPMEPPGPPPAHLQARALPPNIPLTSSDMGPLLHPSAREGQSFPLKNSSPEKPKIVDACTLFKRPGRDTRPDHIVVILRGLPGSGKSYIAKMLRDLEVENGAKAPRIHSMDDYFMTEVEKVEEREVSKSSGSVKGKKRVTKKVIEYCYEPEMEEAYRSSMLKAFKKTLEDGIFTFIIVDDRNLRIADFAQFWASAKRSGYEVYLLEAMYKDPVGCAARNIHGFASDDIQKMVELWEDAPSLYLRLDIQSLLHGDDLKEHGIQEVDMDMDDVACDDDGQSGLPNRNFLKAMEAPQDDCASDDSVKEEERWDAEEDDPGIKELGRSKWSHDADEDDIERSKRAKGASNALSGLIQAYTKEGKSVHWGDQVGKSGFSIGANKRANVLSLVIGPGAGYNLKSNPLPEDENKGAADTSWQSKKRSVFEEQLRAERASERESFKTVVDRRRQRIVGLEMEDEL